MRTVQLLCVKESREHKKEFPRNYSSCLARTWLLPVTYSDYGPCDTHEIWHVRNNWNQAKACKAKAQRLSSGHGGADIFRAAVRFRPQEGRLEGNKPFKPQGRLTWKRDLSVDDGGRLILLSQPAQRWRLSRLRSSADVTRKRSGEEMAKWTQKHGKYIRRVEMNGKKVIKNRLKEIRCY